METNNITMKCNALESLCAFTENDLTELESLSNRLINEDIYGGGLIQKIVADIRTLKTASAKPIRNCDLFGGDFKMLHTAWFDWTGSPSGQNPDGTVKMAFGEWLLAPAQRGVGK